MSKKAWIWGGLAVAGVGATVAVIAVTREPKKSGKTVDTSPPKVPVPAGGEDPDGVFRLEGAGLKEVTCGARNAKSGADLTRVLRSVQEAVRISGAGLVDARNTGLVTEVLSAEAFDKKLSEGIKRIQQKLSGFVWPITKSMVADKLSGLPSCDASAQTWESVASGAIQQAVTAESAPESLWGLDRVLDEESSVP